MNESDRGRGRSRWRAGLGLAGLVLWVLSAGSGVQEQAPADGQAFEITQALLDRILAEALPVVREQLGVELTDLVARRATGEEIVTQLVLENEPILERIQPGQGTAAAERFARSLAPYLLAKYAFVEDTVLVQDEAFSRLAEVTGMPDLASESALRAVLVHELVHAADDERFDLVKTFEHADSADAITAANFVIEGHAQRVARQLVERLGWKDGFETFVRAITAPPRNPGLEEGGAGAEHMQRLQVALIAQAYVEGESFMAALETQGGAEAVERALREPPTDTLTLTNPDWFLHPEHRPEQVYDLSSTIDEVSAEFETDEWQLARQTVAAPAMRAALEPLTPEELDPIVTSMRQNLVLIGVPRVPGQRQLILGLFEFAGAADAESYLARYRVMQHRRDELWKQGAVQIANADYEDLEAPDPHGLLIEKRILAGGTQSDVVALLVTQGPLAIEAVAVNLSDWDATRLVDLAARTLERAARHLNEAEPR